ncbi:hypothetical protein BN7_4530 [Wickerhamomyces ciferrii]|uniref:Selenoprotein O n=1 Tax=Wickerhamomyces ciferrii (strain ATCC 14091 / BCRC 22168 / CBS 111 / JCM 3599 / NBRC 0793 / NRRL Y-1031 F-60-10) TaxID=1206466 RepID=K0KSF3_WICCF|nr:uncharacterized protein BN7_4530 [Wickerhamomyces ciferrii]CCH44957.1 hypothetical protein BN7_4530 [Wickerhamomyces ciferrii]
MEEMTKIPLSQYPKTSQFLKLKPDPLIPSIKEALNLHQSSNQQETEKLFNKPRTLKSGAYQFTRPESRPEYKHLLSSPNALEFLSLPQDSPEDSYYKSIVSGEKFHYDDKIWPYAQAYAGFQFGQFAGQLGDGRVTNLFTLITPNQGNQELQLKGSGKTAFSRFADGKAVLRSSIREFIISESLSGIGIPSTRALSISLLPKTKAQRERAEVCAVVSRFAKSWIRIGTFDLYRWRQDRQGLRELCDYIIEDILDELPVFQKGEFVKDQYKDITEGSDEEDLEGLIEITDSTRYDQMYRAIVRLNAKLVAYWQSYGFLNGVLNTDNTSILGLSIDFGPFSFMDKFNPNFTPNHDDVQLRYSFANQPSIIWWNLTRLGESLVELLGAGPDLVDDEFFIEKGIKKQQEEQTIKRVSSIIQLASVEYKHVFMENYNSIMTQRIGLKTVEQGDNDLIAQLLDLISKTKVDFNKFFINLQNSTDLNDTSIYLTPELQNRLSNPKDKIDQELNDELNSLLSEFIENYKKRLGSTTHKERYSIASKVNPLFTPRNWQLEEVIESMYDDNEDISKLQKLLKMSSNPYDPLKWGDELKDLENHWLDDEGETMTQCSCSS